MSETRQRILDDIKTAMKAGEKSRLATLRLMSAAIKQREVDDRIDLAEDDVIALLDKMLKQRRESIEQYSKAGRDDLVAVEQTESDLIKTYLPEQLTEAEIGQIVDSAVSETGASSVKDMGKVMGLVKPQMQGRADMSSVSKIIKAKLNS